MIRSNQLISFAEDLAVLLKSGSDLDSSLGFMINSRSNGDIKPLITELRTKVRQGLLLSTALEEHQNVFDNFFIGMVRSGEASGQLANALEQLAQQLEKNQELKNQINNALVYPAILAVAMAMSLVLVFAVILPKLTGLFESFGGELSLSAQAMLAVGQFVKNWGQTILVVISISVLLLYLLQEELKTTERINSMMMRIPFIKRLFGQIEFARFTSTLSSLLASGVSQTDALAIAAESFRQADSRKQIENAIVKVKEGQRLSQSIESIDGFGDLYAHSIESGERAGQLPATLGVLAQRLEKNFTRRAQSLASMVEPLLILVLGLVIGLIIYTVFSALQGMGDLPL